MCVPTLSTWKDNIMNLRKLFGTNKTKEQNGVWIDLAADGDPANGIPNTGYCVARAGNRNFREKAQRVYAPYKAQLRNNTLDDELSEKLTTEILAGTVLVGWRGNFNIDGERLEFSEANAIRAMTMFPDFRAQVVEDSNTRKNYIDEEDEAAAKNLPPTPSGAAS